MPQQANKNFPVHSPPKSESGWKEGFVKLPSSCGYQQPPCSKPRKWHSVHPKRMCWPSRRLGPPNGGREEDLGGQRTISIGVSIGPVAINKSGDPSYKVSR